MGTRSIRLGLKPPVDLDPTLRLVREMDCPFKMEFIAFSQVRFHSFVKAFHAIGMCSLAQEFGTIQRALFARPPKDLVHAVVFPARPILGRIPYKDSYLRKFGRQL